MALTPQIKDKAQTALDKGNVLALVMMILRFGMELLEFISERIAEKKAKKQNNDLPSNG
jgi:galactitol-specific phosphotransferase system IIC component